MVCLLTKEEIEREFESFHRCANRYGLTAARALAVPPPSVPFPIRFPGVPEVSSNGSLAAIVAVAALGMIVWERRRRARAQ